MRVIRGQNVNDLYFNGMEELRAHGHIEDSRVGKVMALQEPVTSVYARPKERVLFDLRRAANPFFHLFESLWMLAGRDDVSALNAYVTDFGTRFAESNGRVHGAYGHRWRQALGFDQLNAIVGRLQRDHTDRQCVLQMWDALPETEDTIGNGFFGSNDLLGVWKDRPCNTHVYFRMRQEHVADGLVGSFTSANGMWPFLDMTISCRSNDIIYGAYGANAVHFSVLLEYMAGRLGALVGTMYQISNNYHAYLDVLDRVGQPTGFQTYEGLRVAPCPMGNKWQVWDRDLATFMSWQHELVHADSAAPRYYENRWFTNTAEPMFQAHALWKRAMKHEARSTAQLIEAEDWRVAALQWFDQRTKARNR